MDTVMRELEGALSTEYVHLAAKKSHVSFLYL